MRIRESNNVKQVRMMNLDELCCYTGLGRNTAMKFGKEAKANKRYGKRVLYDRKIIDEALDNLE